MGLQGMKLCTCGVCLGPVDGSMAQIQSCTVNRGKNNCGPVCSFCFVTELNRAVVYSGVSGYAQSRVNSVKWRFMHG